MEPTQILSTFGPWGAVIIAFLAAWKWVIARLEESERGGKKLALEAQARCDTERQAMTEKIGKLEDRIGDIYEDTISKSTDALRANVDAFRRFCEAMDRSHR